MHGLEKRTTYSGPPSRPRTTPGLYQYDTLGWTTSTGYGSTTGWFANVFTAAATEQVAAASFYTASPNATYTLYVYTNVGSSGPTGGTLAGTQSGTIADAGYHTITLSTPVTVTSGQKFSVVVRLTTPGYTYPIAIEYPVGGYSSGPRPPAARVT